MFKKLGLQLYTVRDYLKDPAFADLTFRTLSELGFTEAQTAGNAFDAKEFGALAAKNGIAIIGTHYDYGKILTSPEETMDVHRMWGTTNIGIGAMPSAARESLDELKKFVKDFNAAAALYAKEGFRLTYHNHNFEYYRIDGYKTIMDILYEELDPVNTSFVLDTCWVAAGGADVCAWIEKLKGRLDILHLKDLWFKYDRHKNVYLPTMTEIGHGNLDWKSILATAEKADVKHYVIEQDANFLSTPFESLKESVSYLKPFMK